MAFLPLANIGARKLRTAISMLAIGVGVALFLVLVGLTSMLREIADRTVNVDAHLMVWPTSDQVLVSGGLPAEKVGQGLAAIPGVVRAIPVLTWQLKMAGRTQNVFGIRPEDWPYFRRGEHRLLDGRALRGGDEMVLDSRLAAAGPYAVGDEAERWGRRFKIVGIAREGVAGRVFMPIETVGQCLQQDRLRASFFYLVLAGRADVSGVARAVEDLGLRPIAFKDYYEVLASSFVDMDLVIGAVVFVAAFVCFLVVLLTVYTMVLERTHEIGVLKALGASRPQVFGLVMAEAGLLCLGGIAAGFVLTGAGRAVILHLQPLWSADIPPVRFLWAAVLAAVGTALGALQPAMRAAGQDPVECLRYE